MRTLVIADLHNHTEHADHWLKNIPHDRVVFLGDYFDDFHDTVHDAHLTALWLRERIDSLSPEEGVFLLGNHDFAYLRSFDPRAYCSGYTHAKAAAIHAVLEPRHWERLRLAHAEQGWLLSHAGFHPSLVTEPTAEAILAQCETALAHPERGGALFGAGRDRGGMQPVGGVLWLDWSSFIPIAGLNQIVGHTPGGQVRRKLGAVSRNVCLDVRNGRVAGLLEEGELATPTR